MTIDLRRILGWNTDLELRESEYRRPARIRSGEPLMEAESTLGETYAAAPRPTWTIEPPSFPGLYFIRAARGAPTRVVEVFWQSGYWMAEWSDIKPFRVVGSGFEFSLHPIKEPRR